MGDCLKVMAGLPNKSVDCFVCDLPYGQLSINGKPKVTDEKAAQYGKGRIQSSNDGCCQWDIKIDIVEFWAQVRRLAKDDHTPVLMFCNTKFGVELINSNPKWFRHDLVWDKGRGVSFLSANKMPMKSHEMVYVFSKAGAYYNRIDVKGDFKVVNRLVPMGSSNTYSKQRTGGMKGSKTYNVSKDYNSKTEVKDMPADERCALSVIKVNNSAGKGKHPTEKPMELYEWLLSRYCPKDGLVLDPTAGSFNSILVAKKLGFKAIGIEMDNVFFWKGVAKLCQS